ncbi:MAG: UDP-3-O-acyl-N-acetylglucosamine deacetylase [bacterium]
MMSSCPDRILAGSPEVIRESYRQWADTPVDQEMPAASGWAPDRFQTTLAKTFTAAGPGTYRGQVTRTLRFEPAEDEGWLFNRVDLPDSLPIRVAASNVWTTARNIVLCSGSPHNYMRMVEHIIALRLGCGLDNVVIKVESGDPPLFDRSSLDMVEAVEAAGLVAQARPVQYLTVKEPVCIGSPNGGILAFLPCRIGDPRLLRLDCGVNFPSAIGRQRIKIDITRDVFKHGAFARTNATLGMMMYCRTIGKMFADTRNLGYTKQNILIAGRDHYLNEPHMIHNGKSLEAVWHRAVLDLLAAIALIETGRLVGTVVSFKAGHSLDVLAVKKLFKEGLLVPLYS